MKKVGRLYPAHDDGRVGSPCSVGCDNCLWILGLFSVFTFGIWAFPCHAQDVEQARQSFRKGVERFKSEDYTGALFSFEESYRILPRVTTLFNIGMCQKALILNLEALATFQRFLDEDVADTHPLMRQDAMEALDELEEKVGKIRIEGAPDGSLLTLDGRQAIETPIERPLFVDPGRHIVRVSKSGFESFETAVIVEAGAEVTLKSILKPSVDKDIEIKKLPLPEMKSRAAATFPKQEDAGVSLLLLGGLASSVLGLVGTGVGIIYTVEYYKDRSRASDTRQFIADFDDIETDAYIDLYNEIVTRELPADEKGMIAGYVTGGVLLVGGLIIVLIELTGDDSESHNNRVSLRPNGFVLSF